MPYELTISQQAKGRDEPMQPNVGPRYPDSMADTDRPDESHEQTLSLLRSLGFVRTPEQAAEYRAKIAAAAKKNTPENWAKVRERLGLPVRVV